MKLFHVICSLVLLHPMLHASGTDRPKGEVSVVSKHKLSFAVHFKDEVSSYRVLGLSVSPSQELDFSVK
ncbi:MAG: hypothetical protein JSU96_02515, partial [Acidobacteriota bacterium]